MSMLNKHFKAKKIEACANYGDKKIFISTNLFIYKK